MNVCNRIWGAGQLLAFSALDGVAPYSDGLVARTTSEGYGIEVMWPKPVMIRFGDIPQARCEMGGDFFRILGDGTGARGGFANAWNLVIDGECSHTTIPEELVLLNKGKRLLIAIRGKEQPALLDEEMDGILQARAGWLQKLLMPADLPHHLRPLFIKAASIMKTQLYTPEGRIKHRWSTPDRFPHRDMWLWDSVFHAIGWRHLDPALARELISAVLDCQCADGFVPHMMTPQRSSDITQPPVLAYGVRLVDEAQPCDEWLAALYEPLGRYLAWDQKNRDSDGAGLVEWFIEGDPMCRSGESGMDNSSRFDAATRMDAVDFNCFLAKEYECIAGFATRLGRVDDATKWTASAQAMRERIRTRLWDDRRRFFYDYDVEQAKFCPVAAVSGFLPLFCGAADAAQAQRLCEMLNDSESFGTPLPLPSVSRAEASFGTDMWRGPSWLNMAWLIAEGLRDYGYTDEAERLRVVWLEQVSKYHARFGSIFEYYDACDKRTPMELTRKGKIGDFPHQVIRDYGWSATLSLDWCSRSYAGR